MKLDILLAEIGQAWRSLIRRPSYLALAGTTLALGIATTSVTFSLLDQAILQPLAFPQSDQLVTLGLELGDGNNIGAPAFYQHLQDNSVFSSMGIVSAYVRNANISNEDAAVVASSLSADSGYLRTLGIRMSAGRNFNTEEDMPNGPSAVILSHAFWMSRFGGNANVTRQMIRLEGKSVPIVGVLPEDFAWPVRFDLLVPMQLRPGNTSIATNEHIVARLPSDSDITAINGQINTRMHALITDLRSTMNEEHYDYLSRQTYAADPLINIYTGISGLAPWLFFGAALCVLLIAAINLTNLMIVRAITRSHGMAVRAALGAPTLRLALPSLAEGLLVGIVGSLIGIFLAWSGLRLLGGLVPPEWLRGRDVQFTGMTWVFAFAVSAGVALLAASLSVWRGQYDKAVQELVVGGRTGWSRGASVLGRVLVIAQTAIAVVLLVGAALFTRSVFELASIPMGFDSQSVMTFSLSPIRDIYSDVRSVEQQGQRIIDRLRQIPGIQAVSASTNLPTGSQFNLTFTLPDDRATSVQYRQVTADFLRVFNIPVVAGRELRAEDIAGSEPVCAVSVSFAESYLDKEPLGKILKIAVGPKQGHLAMRVVGVVGDVRQYGPDQPPPPIVYLPFAQVPDNIWSVVRGFMPLNYAVSVRGEPGSFEAQIRAAIREVEPMQPIANVQPMQAVVASTTSSQKLNLLVVGVFAGLALLLACVGLYAVMSVAVMARQHEFGVRAALGAPPRRLLQLVLKESLAQIVIGLLIGLLIALAMSRLIQRFLFGVSPADPVAIAAVLVVLLLAGIAASLPPALRASRVHPMRALGTE